MMSARSQPVIWNGSFPLRVACCIATTTSTAGKLSYFGRAKSLSWKLHGFDSSLRSLLKLAWTTWDCEGWGASCPFHVLVRGDWGIR